MVEQQLAAVESLLVVIITWLTVVTLLWVTK